MAQNSMALLKKEIDTLNTMNTKKYEKMKAKK